MVPSATVYVSLAMLLHLSDAVSVLTAGQTGKITCGIIGKYSFPEWVKDATLTISNQGSPPIHPTLRDRFAFDPMNNRSLSISNVQTGDAGSYVCTHNGGTNSPQTTIVKVEAPTTTTSPTTTSSTTTLTASTASTTTTSPQAPPAKSPSTPRSAEENGFTKTIKIIVVICICGAAAIVVFIVLLVTRHWKHQKEKKYPNEKVEFQGRNVNSRNKVAPI